MHSGYRLAHDAQLLCNAFEEMHNKNGLPGKLEIPMESFARAVEIMRKGCWNGDTKHERPDQSRWVAAVKACGYVQARLAVRTEMAPAAGRALEIAQAGSITVGPLAVLPILTFDEARLSPSHGYIFNRRWLCLHETILGIAWKLARMNALPGHIVAKQLALRPVDPYEGIPPTDSHVAVSLLARTFAIPRKALADGLHKTDGGQHMHARLRFCTACMALAHHDVMHQRIGSSRRPWHGVALEEHRRGCGRDRAVPAQREAARLAVPLCRMPPALCGLDGPADAAGGIAGTPPRHHAGTLWRLNSPAPSALLRPSRTRLRF